MNFKVVDKPAFQVYGIERHFDLSEEQHSKEIPHFWTEIMDNGDFDKLLRSANCPSTINAVCGYEIAQDSVFPYMICTLKTPLSDTAGYQVVNVPAGRWAIFANEQHPAETVTQETQALFKKIFNEWLPSSDYTLLPGYEFEMYYTNLDGSCYEEIWCRLG